MCLRSLFLVSLILMLAGCKVEIDVIGSGKVESETTPKNDCPLTQGNDYCWEYQQNTTVNLTPIASDGYEFIGWDGDCSGMGYCTIKVSEDKQVIAKFVHSSKAKITNTSHNLKHVLENGQLHGACSRYHNEPNSRKTEFLKLMCGKEMFFYEGFNILGVPKPLVDYMTKKLPRTVGKAFTKMGMIKDPYSSEDYPLGFPKGKNLGLVETVSFGCASCHFGKISDGRYSVGAPNHDYDYGKQVISLLYTMTLASAPDFIPLPLEISDKVKNYLQPQVKEIQNENNYLELILSLKPLSLLLFSDQQIPAVSTKTQNQYLSWKKGTQDFLIAPVGLEDNVHTISKIQSLWDLYTPEQMVEHGGPYSSLLGFTGPTVDLYDFVSGFIALSVGKEEFTREKVKPLVDYILSLKAPKNSTYSSNTQVNNGSELFESSGCIDCHNGPSYSGTRLFSYSEIGTDSAMMYWADENGDGIANEGVQALIVGQTQITNKLKAPKLSGIWANKLFLHNGSVDSLEQLLCIDDPRTEILPLAFGKHGHQYGCNLPLEDKQELIAFLKTL